MCSCSFSEELSDQAVKEYAQRHSSNIPVVLFLFLNREVGQIIVSVDEEVSESGSKGNK